MERLAFFALFLGWISLALDPVQAKGSLLRKKDDSRSTSLLMAKIHKIFASCEGCVETASPSPQEVTHGGNLSPSNSSPVTPSSPGSSGSQPSSASNASPVSGTMMPTMNFGVGIMNERQVTSGNHFMGCYVEEGSPESYTVTAEAVEECGDKCKAPKYFSVIGTDCRCYIYPPATMLDFGECSSDGDKNKMDLYLAVNVDESCSEIGARSYREKLTQQDRELGFDHVKNEWKRSIFFHYSNKCNTNIYDVATAVSEDLSSYTTYVSTMKEYSEEMSSSSFESISTEAEAGYDAGFWSASAKVSASEDKDVSSLLKSSGSQSAESRIFYSYGVKRLVEIKQNFANKKHQIMFNDEFIDALKQYKDSNFEYFKAKEIFERYGTTVLQNGFVGGFAERRATMIGSEYSSSIETSEKAEACYQKSIEAEGNYGGFSGSGSIDTSKCDNEAYAAMQASRSKMTSEKKSTRTVGGKLSADEFEVTADSAELLTSSKMYPLGKTLKLRLMTSYLTKDKIHPWEYKQWQLLPDEFEEIHSKLQEHLIRLLKEKDSAITKCTPCKGSLYLEEDPGKNPPFNCGCYDPKPLVDEPCETTEDCNPYLGVEWEEKDYRCVESTDVGKRCTICQNKVCKLKTMAVGCSKNSECATNCCLPGSIGTCYLRILGVTCLGSEVEDELLLEM